MQMVTKGNDKKRHQVVELAVDEVKEGAKSIWFCWAEEIQIQNVSKNLYSPKINPLTVRTFDQNYPIWAEGHFQLWKVTTDDV